LSETAISVANDAKQIALLAKKDLTTVTQTANNAQSTATEAKNLALAAEQIRTSVEGYGAKITVLEGFASSLAHLTLIDIASSTPFLVANSKQQLTLKKGTHIILPLENRVLVADYTSDQTITVPSSLARGKDYYVYLVFEGEQSSKVVVSPNSTYPDGYTANNSRKIGG
ncbi:hypothetical protein ME1_00001, partial [Bartonella vinsonii subsp. arupensis OK-94-513]